MNRVGARAQSALITAFVAFFLATSLMAQDSLVTKRDTLFYLRPIIVTATEAHARETPATFSNLTQEQLADRYTMQDVPVLLSELPSMTYYSENGNGIGYNYVNLRGFDQRRLSVMINGVPQNDPEDHNVYWIDFPDLLGSTGSIQVQRGAGSDFYGPPAIGGSINLATNPFNRRPGTTLEMDLGFQLIDLVGIRQQHQFPPPLNQEVPDVGQFRTRRRTVHVLRPARKNSERRLPGEFMGRSQLVFPRGAPHR